MPVSVAELRAIIDCISEAVVYKDAGGVVKLINRAAEELLGLGREQVQGLSPAEYPWRGIHEDGSPYQLDQHPSLVTLRTGLPLRDQIMGLLRPDNGVVWLSINTMPVFGPGQDKPCGVVASFRSVTQARQVAEEIRLNQERLRVALAPVDLAVFHQDRDLRYTWIFKPQLGYSIKEIIGKTDAELLPEAAARVVMQIKRQVLASGMGTREDVPVDAADGLHIYDLVVEPLRDAHGAIVGITGSSLDISQARREMQWKNQELAELAQKSADINAALRVLLEQRQQEKQEVEQRLLANIEKLVKPYLVHLASQGLPPRQAASLDVALNNLNELTRRGIGGGFPFGDLSPREIQIAHMVREGLSSKDIAELLGISVRSVDLHRLNLRRKLGLRNKGKNLRTYLLNQINT